MRMAPEAHQRVLQVDKLAQMVEAMQMQAAAGGGRDTDIQVSRGGDIEDRLVEMIAGGSINRSRMRQEAGLKETAEIGAHERQQAAAIGTHERTAATRLQEIEAESEAASRLAGEERIGRGKLDMSLEAQRQNSPAVLAAAGASAAAEKGTPTVEQSQQHEMNVKRAEVTGTFPGDDPTKIPYADRRILAQKHLEAGGSQESALQILNGELNPAETTLFKSTSPEYDALLEEMAGKLDESSWLGGEGRPWEEESLIDWFANAGSNKGYFSTDDGTGPGTPDRAYERAQMLIDSDPRYQLYGITAEDVVRRYRREHD
jgi:hypothetical protein